ncbi:MAG: hypothetical protein ACYS67_04830 [Planctomycetota bacterium]|jgi:chromosome segregation ATPase
MKTINWRPKHGVVLALLLVIGVAVFQEKSCYGTRKPLYKKDLTIKDRLVGQMIKIDEMSINIQKAESLLKSLEGSLGFRNPKAREDYAELVKTIQKLIGKPKEIKDEIQRLSKIRNDTLKEVNELKGDKKTLETEKEKLQREKDSIEAENNKLVVDVNDLKVEKGKLQKDIGSLEGKVKSLETAKTKIKAWFGGGMTTSVAGIIFLVLKIMSQRKDIQLKQIEIDKKSKKE